MEAHNYRSWAPNLYENEIKLRNYTDLITPEEIVKKVEKQYVIYEDISNKYKRSDLISSINSFIMNL